MPPTSLVSSYNTSEEHVSLALSSLSPIEEELFHLFASNCRDGQYTVLGMYGSRRLVIVLDDSCWQGIKAVISGIRVDTTACILHHPALETNSTLSLLSCPKMRSLSFMYITPRSTQRNELYPFHCLFYELASYSQLPEHASVLIKKPSFYVARTTSS